MDKTGQQHGLEVNFLDSPVEKSISTDIQVLFFQAVRELLVNVAKHAQAHTVHVSVQRKHMQIVVTLKDDGIGCDPEKAMSQGDGFGLLSISEALNRLGGQLVIISIPNSGCEAIMTAPIRTG